VSGPTDGVPDGARLSTDAPESVILGLVDADPDGILDAAPDGILSIGEDGRVQTANRRIERLFGYVRTELRGMPVDSLIPGLLWLLPESQSDANRGQWPRDALQVSGRRSDGTELPLNVVLSPLYTERGRRVVAVVRGEVPIAHGAGSDPHMAKEVLDTLADAVWVLDAQTLRLQYVNGGLLTQLGYSEEELLGNPVELIAPELSDSSFRALMSGLPQETSRSVLHGAALRRVDGVDLAVEVRTQALTDTGDPSRPRAYVSVARELQAGESR
jgi:PAS domain S-box-containing protein